MSPTHSSALNDPQSINRREALKRTALLLGVALSPSILAGALRAQTPAAGAAAKPVYLTAAQFATAAAAAERILPRSDTPGAADVGVPAFIDLMVAEYMTPAEKQSFLAGLADLDAAGVQAHRKAFPQLSGAEQDALLKRIATAAQGKTGTFFHQLREVTLAGYFTSETVGKTVTHYDPIPGPFQGCIPIAQVGNVVWTR
jgi:hypothetical protein